MPGRRILSLWFPYLGAERVLRTHRGTLSGPLAVFDAVGTARVISSLNAEARAQGLSSGQPLRDAQAMCAALVIRERNLPAERAFLSALRRWAGRFSPWVAEQGEDGLIVDLTGAAHLFGGEEGVMHAVEEDCAASGLSVRIAIADTVGAAWAVARYGGQGVQHVRSGDAIDQEARATRSRAVRRRHWTRGGSAPQVPAKALGGSGRIVPPGQLFAALSPLPVAALRIPPDMVEQLGRLGLRRIGDLLGQPRAPLARRFGTELVLRLDQAMGGTAEPVSPARAPLHFAVRMSFPDPIGIQDDIMAALDRILPRLCDHLARAERGVRTLRIEAFRVDQSAQSITVGLARPDCDVARLRPLVEMKIDEIDAGYGIDMIRAEAIATEPLSTRVMVGHLGAGRAARDRLEANTGLDDLIGRIGARVGLEAITRFHPASSHIPEKTALTLAAAWSEPVKDWPEPPLERPLLIWRPEPVQAPDAPQMPAQFRWRRTDWDTCAARGPERLSPEWWLDDPNWRSGVRDYWVVTTGQGERLWLFYAHGAAMSSGWFCHGRFA